MAINVKFLELPEEKRQKIINAGFEVFAQSDYKHASTEEIAIKAGISKGLLFYYFHNKNTFYMFLFEHAVSRVKEYVLDTHIGEIDDFFELCAYAAERKYRMMTQTPYIMDFVVRAFYAQREEVPEDITTRLLQETANIFGAYFQGIDYTRFRENIDPKEIYHMLTWMVDGYMHERQRTGQSIDLHDIMGKFRLWSDYFKRVSYKEEYLK